MLKSSIHNPETITERVRADARQRLLGTMNDFVEEGTPEEIFLLLQVLEHWDSNSGPKTAEIGLASSFAFVFGEQERYISVPEEHLDQVQDFIRWIESQEGECK